VRQVADDERDAVASNAQRQVAALSRERDASQAAADTARAEMSALEARLAAQTQDAAQAVSEALSALQREREKSDALQRELDARKDASAGGDRPPSVWEEERAQLQAALAEKEGQLLQERQQLAAQLSESEQWMRQAMEAQRTSVADELSRAKEAVRVATADADTARVALATVTAERDALQSRHADGGGGAYEQARELISSLQAQLESAVLAAEEAQRRAADAEGRLAEAQSSKAALKEQLKGVFATVQSLQLPAAPAAS
jgi:hypothetical protein